MRLKGLVKLIVMMGCFVVAGCAVQHAQVAQDAQGKTIGLTKEQVLACMGPPANRMTEGPPKFGATIPAMATRQQLLQSLR
jgi:hypothetical protein